MKNKAQLLREHFRSKSIIRLVGAHDGLGAKLIEQHGFEGVWASGLEISTSFGVPDANILTMTDYLHAASVMNEATALPIICDCDTGYGNVSNVIHMVKKYEAAGLAAVVIEDKNFPKVNSFIPGRQDLAPITEFVSKIEAAKETQAHSDFMVFARVEALIAGWGMEEALKRAYAYAEAGADGIVIHSKATSPQEIFSFAKKWKSPIPLVAIPTSYPNVCEQDLARHGFKMVIYANQGLRASIKAMNEVFQSIAQVGSTTAIEHRIASMKEVFQIQGMPHFKENEKRFEKKDNVQAIILAAGDHRSHTNLKEILNGSPLCMLDIGGKTVLEHQADNLRSCGVKNIVVVGGYAAQKIRMEGVDILVNPKFKTTSIAYSLLSAQDYFNGKCVMLYSDVFFDRQIVDKLLESPHAITLVVDRAYRSLPARDKKLDLVITQNERQLKGRKLNLSEYKILDRIGGKITKTEATHEFIGVALFQEAGLKMLKQKWQQALEEFKGKSFYGAPSVEKADFTDLIQYVIDADVEVHGMEIEHGWSEIHSTDDYERVSSHAGLAR